MKKKAMVLIIFLLLFVSGCISRMEHPTKSSTQWTKDHKACEQTVRKLIREDPDSYDTLDEMKLIETCMKKKGWRPKPLFRKSGG